MAEDCKSAEPTGIVTRQYPSCARTYALRTEGETEVHCDACLWSGKTGELTVVGSAGTEWREPADAIEMPDLHLLPIKDARRIAKSWGPLLVHGHAFCVGCDHVRTFYINLQERTAACSWCNIRYSMEKTD